MRQFVLKVHELCNLACDHCYVYEHADQTWRDRPATMSVPVVQRVAARIAEHAVRHRLPQVGVVLHGGEPLLLGPARLREILTVLRSTVGAATALDLRMQTNGIRLDETTAELLLEFGVRAGVSLDGDRAANDRHRRYRNGASSHERTLRGLALLRSPRYRPAYAGILCTIDVRNDPIAVYEALLEQEPPRIDLLLPHATWDDPPPHAAAGTTPYADWLVRLHRRWLADGRPVPIRLFDALHATAAGRDSGVESVGIDRGELAVVETDGSWEQPDSMKTTFHGAAATGLTVFSASADDLLATPAMRRRQAGLDGLGATCRACPVVTRCGGGLFAHRFRSGAGFANPSVYCADLKGLISAMHSDPPSTVSAAAGRSALPGPVLDELASGGGDGACIAHLTAAQESINRALLVAASESLTGAAAAAWSLLAELDKDRPDAVRRVLTQPFTRAWAVRLLSGRDDPARLADLAAAAAVIAGAGTEVAVTPRDGRVHLPTLGTLTLPDAGVPEVLVSGTGTVRWPDGGTRLAPDSPGWAPTASIALDDLTVRLEDADPYRDCHDWPPAGPLTPGDRRAWAASLRAAWPSVLSDAPEQAAGLAGGLTTITPLVPDGVTLRSATSRQAYGALGIALTPDPAAMAVMLVHEFQHTKLGAVLDLIDLVDPDATVLTKVGWRPDPRPAEGVLQGIYAHLAVADMWRHRAARGEPGAGGHYATYREWTAAAIGELSTSGALTAPGRRFMDRLAATIEAWPG
ncbi:FxsB family cyclophane-forming radical SAM/SPASM peptide maturase [Actinoplanes sp. NPDC023801]|uniref:FxsB family cyclophane-forming radical SAM/SPASM peptide maturase n=1 Tax=Actinoplanes sp. NPDC023801 TaxID=3154595 RepID=UPI0033FE41A0